jgi:microcystin-dependent protein
LPLEFNQATSAWKFIANGSLMVPVGVTGQRPSPPAPGMMRFNVTLNVLEIYGVHGVADWLAVSVGAVIGSITAYAGFSPPEGYFECDGSRKSKITYANLWNVIGTAWDPAPAETTFAIPDLRGYVLAGRTTTNELLGEVFDVGEKAGTKDQNITLTIANMPKHAHDLVPQALTTPGTGMTTAGAGYINGGMSKTQEVGGDQPFNVSHLQPTGFVKYIIKY